MPQKAKFEFAHTYAHLSRRHIHKSPARHVHSVGLRMLRRVPRVCLTHVPHLEPQTIEGAACQWQHWSEGPQELTTQSTLSIRQRCSISW
jgi:hypothetical protein